MPIVSVWHDSTTYIVSQNRGVFCQEKDRMSPLRVRLWETVDDRRPIRVVVWHLLECVGFLILPAYSLSHTA